MTYALLQPKCSGEAVQLCTRLSCTLASGGELQSVSLHPLWGKPLLAST